MLSSLCDCGDVQIIELLLSASNTVRPHSSALRRSSEVKLCLTQFDIGSSIPPIDSYVNIFVLGDPGVGKSTLVKVLTKRNTANSISRALPLTSITSRDVEAHTVGIIPYRLEHKEIGNILLHDLAGQPEYYLSHSAILECCLESTVAVFVFVVDLRDENLCNVLEKWLSMIANTKFSDECQFIVVGSHFDLCKKEGENVHKTISNLFIKHMNISSVNYIGLDCRSLGGTSMSSLVSLLSKSCDTVRKYPKSVTNTQYTRMLYAYLIKCNVNAETLSSIIDMIQCADGCYLPSSESDIISSLHYLHASGLIMFLMVDENQLHNSWVIVNKQILLNEVNGVLFDERKNDAVSRNGLISESDLSSLFPKYSSTMLIKFLTSMKLCILVDEALLSYTNLSIAKPSFPQAPKHVPHETILFFPSLMKDIKRPLSFMRPFSFGWCLKCSDCYFPSRFLHVLLLSICYKYALPKTKDNPLQRLCTVWINGALWSNDNGIETLLEFSDNGKLLVVLMSCHEGFEKNMVTHRTDVIKHILNIQTEVCPNLSHSEYLIDCTELNYPVNDVNQLNMFHIEQVASCVLKKKQFVVSSNGKGSILLSSLLPGESNINEDLSIFAGRKPQDFWPKEAHHLTNDSHVSQHRLLILDLFQTHFSKLCNALGSPRRLADELWSAHLVEFSLIDDIGSLNLSRYMKSERIFETIFRSLRELKESKKVEFFEAFCDVLKNHDDPTIKDITIEMITEYSKMKNR